MTNAQLLAVARFAFVVGLVALVVYLVRRHRPAGLGAAIAAPVQLVGTTFAALGGWSRKVSNSLEAHSRRETASVVTDVKHPLGMGVMYALITAAWITAMTFYVVRNQNIVLGDYNAGVEAGVIPPNGLRVAQALAEVYAPILLTAAAGIIVFEALGLSHHVPFLHSDRRWTTFRWTVIALVILAIAMVAQFSVARQDMLAALGLVQQTTQELRDEAIPPLPLDPTAAEVATDQLANERFDQRVTAPALAEYESTVGPLGWRTWLPIGAALIDFVFAFALVPTLILLWGLVVRILRLPLELAAAAADGVAFVARLIGGMLLTILGLAMDGEPELVGAGAGGQPVRPGGEQPPPARPQPSNGDAPAPNGLPQPPWRRGSEAGGANPAAAAPPAEAPDAFDDGASVDRFNPFRRSPR